MIFQVSETGCSPEQRSTFSLIYLAPMPECHTGVFILWISLYQNIQISLTTYTSVSLGRGILFQKRCHEPAPDCPGQAIVLSAEDLGLPSRGAVQPSPHPETEVRILIRQIKFMAEVPYSNSPSRAKDYNTVTHHSSCLYRVTRQNGKNIPLTWIWDVSSSCLGSREPQ